MFEIKPHDGLVIFDNGDGCVRLDRQTLDAFSFLFDLIEDVESRPEDERLTAAWLREWMIGRGWGRGTYTIEGPN